MCHMSCKLRGDSVSLWLAIYCYMQSDSKAPFSRLKPKVQSKKSFMSDWAQRGGSSCCHGRGTTLAGRFVWRSWTMKCVVWRCVRDLSWFCNFCRTMGLLQLLKNQFLCHLIICCVFVVSGIIINLLQLCTLPLWLVSKQLFRRINIRLGYCISSREYCSYSLLYRWHWNLLSVGMSFCWNERICHFSGNEQIKDLNYLACMQWSCSSVGIRPLYTYSKL